MKKKTEKEDVQQTDVENSVYFNRSMRRWARKFVTLRIGYKYFTKNKGWILSLLFVLSIIRSSIWYACFGVNILTYSSLQDIFISFADYFMSIIVIGIILISFYLFYPQNIGNKFEKIIFLFFSILFLIAILWIILSLYRMIFSIVVIITIFYTLYSYLVSKRKIAFLQYTFFWLLALTLFQPLEQYLYNRAGINGTANFREQSAHYDYISFDYNDAHIDTKTSRYYLIGGNSNYYFILDREAGETLIIAKSECKNIKSHPFGLHSLLFLNFEKNG